MVKVASIIGGAAVKVIGIIVSVIVARLLAPYFPEFVTLPWLFILVLTLMHAWEGHKIDAKDVALTIIAGLMFSLTMYIWGPH